MSETLDKIKDCDARLRAGKIDEVIDHLRTLNVSNVPRELRLPYANLCRRCGLWQIGLRLLAKFVRGDQVESHGSSTDPERAEYAVLLMKAGSVLEAIGILDHVSEAVVPDATMYRAFCEMALWNYDRAIDFLEKYLDKNSNSYLSMVARVNLVASLIWAERYREAEDLLNRLISEAKASDSVRLLANCYELRSQVLLLTGDLAACRRDLELARKILTSRTSDQLFVRKWQAVLESTATQTIEPLTEFRKEADSRGDWESVRDCDFYSLKMSFSQDLFNYLICGTPHQSFREKACRTLDQVAPTGSYILGGEAGPRLILSTGMVMGGASVVPGQKIHQMLSILFKDFYKPVSLGSLFAELFPNEYYDAFTSPGRVHQILWRTRQFIRKAELPLVVHADESGVIVKSRGDFSAQLEFDRSVKAGPEAQIEKLKFSLNFTKSDFSVIEASQVLQLSVPSARRILRWGVENQKLLRQGAGPSTRYQLMVTTEKKAA